MDPIEDLVDRLLRHAETVRAFFSDKAALETAEKELTEQKEALNKDKKALAQDRTSFAAEQEAWKEDKDSLAKGMVEKERETLRKDEAQLRHDQQLLEAQRQQVDRDKRSLKEKALAEEKAAFAAEKNSFFRTRSAEAEEIGKKKLAKQKEALKQETDAFYEEKQRFIDRKAEQAAEAHEVKSQRVALEKATAEVDRMARQYGEVSNLAEKEAKVAADLKEARDIKAEYTKRNTQQAIKLASVVTKLHGGKYKKESLEETVDMLAAEVDALLADKSKYGAEVNAFLADKSKHKAEVDAFLIDRSKYEAELAALLADKSTFEAEKKNIAASVERVLSQKKADLNGIIYGFLQQLHDGKVPVQETSFEASLSALARGIRGFLEKNAQFVADRNNFLEEKKKFDLEKQSVEQAKAFLEADRKYILAQSVALNKKREELAVVRPNPLVSSPKINEGGPSHTAQTQPLPVKSRFDTSSTHINTSSASQPPPQTAPLAPFRFIPPVPTNTSVPPCATAITQGPLVSFTRQPPGNSNDFFEPGNSNTLFRRPPSNNSAQPPTSTSATKVSGAKDLFGNPHASNIFQANSGLSSSTSVAPQIPVLSLNQQLLSLGRPSDPSTFLQAAQTPSTFRPYTNFLRKYASRQALAAGTYSSAPLAAQRTVSASVGMSEADTEDDDGDDGVLSESETSFHSCSSDSGAK